MPQKKKTRTRKVAKATRRNTGAAHELFEYHVERCLQRRKLKTLNGYAWRNENDPDLVGIAMWELDMSNEHAGPLHKRQIAGEDFYGLMALARLSIGMTLFSSQFGGLGVVTNPYYRLHWFNSVVNLSTASDRLRDVLTWTLHGMLGDDYTKQLLTQAVPGSSLWAYPFENVPGAVFEWRVAKHVRRDLRRLVPRMGARAARIAANRAQRNKLIHKVATLDGEIEKSRETLAKRREEWESMTLQALLASRPRSSDYRAKLNAQNRVVCDWYRDLVHLADAVFQIEHWSRKRAT